MSGIIRIAVVALRLLFLLVPSFGRTRLSIQHHAVAARLQGQRRK